MLYRVNRVVLLLALCLLLAGAALVLRLPSWELETVVRLGRFIRPLLLLAAALGLVPVLSWSIRGIARLFRTRNHVWGVLASLSWLVVSMNLLFWGLVQMDVAPVRQLFEKGRVVWVGRHALLFGHGYWQLSDGYWQHQTVIRLRDGTVYRGPTLDLLTSLRRRGASGVWGTWCYSGNYPYIRKDLVTGEEEPWPSYASYNRAPGVTIPIWIGTAFVRLAWPQQRYTTEPPSVGPVVADTLYLRQPSMDRIEQAFALMQQRIRGLPRPDSVSWHPVTPDTVYSISRIEYAALPLAERREIRDRERAELAEKARTGLALYWIRGRAFPVFIRVPAQLHRPPDPPIYAVHDGAAGHGDDAPGG